MVEDAFTLTDDEGTSGKAPDLSLLSLLAADVRDRAGDDVELDDGVGRQADRDLIFRWLLRQRRMQLMIVQRECSEGTNRGNGGLIARR